MRRFHDGLREFFEGIASQAAAERDPHRKAILENYLGHAALEYTDRWEEIFDPVRTVAHPLYKVRLGTSEDVVYDGIDEVKNFYRGMKDDTFLTNDDQRLAVNDWGFMSFLKINLFVDAAKARSMGFDVKGEGGHYVVISPAAMYWTYDKNAKLIGEYVYGIGDAKLEVVPPEDIITYDELQAIVAPYLPPQSAR